MIIILNPTPGYYLWAGIYSLLGLSNFEFWKNTVDYFAPTTSLNPFTHTWSLGVEEQFYFILPLLAWFSGFAKGGLQDLVCTSGIVRFSEDDNRTRSHRRQQLVYDGLLQRISPSR